MKKPFLKRLKNKYVIIGAVVVLIALVMWARSGSSAPTFQFAPAALGDVIETVSVTGAVSPIGKADLAFEKSGVIAKIYVQVGQSIKAGDPIASLDTANDAAALASAQATLADLSRSLTPQELAVQQSQVLAAHVAVGNAEKDAINASHDALVKAQGAIFNYTDVFFSNPQSPNPTISIRTPSSNVQTAINTERAAMSDLLNKWAADIAGATSSQAVDVVSEARSDLATIKGFMNDLSAIVVDLNPGNSGLSQTQINSLNLAMNSGLSAVNGAIDSVTSSQSALMSAAAADGQAVTAYNLKLAGNSSQSIASQAAKVAQAQAQLDQDTLRSPIDGIVTRVDPNVGEFVAAGNTGFAVQNSDFKVEARVPEADIAKISVGNAASTTLDAYGSSIDFPTQVISIDPAETIIEGVPTYKVTLSFVRPDARIRSGMTANLDILTHAALHVLQIPYRAIVTSATSTTVRIVSADGKSYASVPVVTGLKGSSGTIEIKSGLNVGDKVVTYLTP